MRPSIQPARHAGLCGCLLSLALTVSPLAADDAVSFCFNDWPPYATMSDEGPGGVTVKIVERAAGLVGREARFVEREWSECLRLVEDGELDAILDAAKRVAYLQGPTSFNSYTDTFWVSNRGKINRYDQLQGGKIALVEGYNYADSLLAQLESLQARIVRGADDPSNIRALADGEFDAAVADLASTFAFTREHDLPVHPILPPFSVDLLYVSFNREKVELQREFDRAFARLIEQGVVDEIYVEHIGTPYSSFSAAQ